MKMRRLILCIIVVLAAGVFLTSVAQDLVKATPEEVGMSTQRLERLTNSIQTYVDNGQLAGAVALVTRKGKVAYFESFGSSDVENNVPMTENSIFRIASQSKAIISVGIMILQEEGKLLISDAVGKYIPEFSETTVAVPVGDSSYNVVPGSRSITIRDLLTHTAGIGYGRGPAADQWEEAGIQGWYFADRNEPILTTIQKMASLPFDAQPGDRFVYGYNTDILGALIEVVSGETLDAFIYNRILEPLEMKDTHFYLPEDKRDRLTVVYSSTDDGIERTPEEGGMISQGAYIDGPRMSFSGGAGFLSTAMDYAKFLQMMLNEGELNGERILSRKTVELMTVDHLGSINNPWTNGTGFGLGFSVVTDLGTRGKLGSQGSYGWGGAYHTTYLVDPAEELVITYFTQLIPARNINDHDMVKTLIYQSIID